MRFLKNIWFFRPLNSASDVMDNADCPVQTAAYNASYRAWRTRRENEFAFHGSSRQNAYSFVDGVGMSSYQPAEEQRRVWRQLSSLLLGDVLLYLLADIALPMVSIVLLHLAGVEIYYSFQEHTPYGQQIVVLLILMISHILRYLLPLLYLNRKLKMPVSVGYPLRIGERWNSCLAICGMLLLFCLTDVGLVLTDRVSNSVNMDIYYVMNHMDKKYYHIYLLMEMLVIPILAELLFRGALFQAFRQFGVWFAILVMALLEIISTRSPLAALIILPTALFTGLAVWISGSMITGMIIHVLYRVMRYLIFLSPNLPVIFGLSAKWYLLLMVMLVGLTGCVLLLMRRKFQVQDHRTFLNSGDTLRLLVSNAPIIIVWSIGILTMSANLMI